MLTAKGVQHASALATSTMPCHAIAIQIISRKTHTLLGICIEGACLGLRTECMQEYSGLAAQDLTCAQCFRQGSMILCEDSKGLTAIKAWL